jgi:S-methylmethionine-dependent homocysteine/selenocysteine methylase
LCPPTHFATVLAADKPWVERIWGIRATASPKSHAELNESENLDDDSPEELGNQHHELLNQFPRINVLGGCCGTDDRHVTTICKACLPVAWSCLAMSHQTASILK